MIYLIIISRGSTNIIFYNASKIVAFMNYRTKKIVDCHILFLHLRCNQIKERIYCNQKAE